MKLILRSILIPVIGVGVIDYFSHLFFSTPMETPSYFLAKMTLYFVFSLVVLRYYNFKNWELPKVIVAGITVSLLWGAYYNVLPSLLHYYPFGIALRGLSFLGMGILGTGLAFGLVHTLAFVGGYYATKFLGPSK